MINKAIRLKAYPSGIKWALLFLVLGWLLHFLVYFKFLSEGESQRNVVLMVSVGVGICYFVAGINRWARALCLFFNVGIIGMYVLLGLVYLQQGEKDLVGLAAMIVVTFSLSTYFLISKESAEFFKSYNQVETDAGAPPQAEDK